jgi:HEAT repeat protein
LISDPDTLVRGVAAAALGRVSEELGGLEALEKATHDPEPSVRWNACFALGKMGNPGAKRGLRFAENDPDGSVRLAARKALEALGLDPPMPTLYELEQSL